VNVRISDYNGGSNYNGGPCPPQTELAEKYPIDAVCEWIGNSRAIAKEHYLQATDAHFAQAIAQPPEEQKLAKSAAQNPAQSEAVSVGKGEESGETRNGKWPRFTERFRPTPMLA
jgi:hypothetical protein